MNITEYAKTLFYSGKLEDKLLDPSAITDMSGNAEENILSTLRPERENKIIFSQKQIKFPKKSTLHLDERKALALHFFANHELLAIEMMAAALLFLPVDEMSSKRIKTGILSTIKDEQKHFKMYVNRMNDFGVDFGDFPVNDYFWRQMQKINTFDQYFAVMALTFEAANLDFARSYAEIFHKFEDEKTGKILDIVYQDEISHVGFGVRWLNLWKQDKTLWEYYRENLPDLLTPARAKGIAFDFDGRKKSGLDDDFINQIMNYRDEFIVTNRKEW